MGLVQVEVDHVGFFLMALEAESRAECTVWAMRRIRPLIYSNPLLILE